MKSVKWFYVLLFIIKFQNSKAFVSDKQYASIPDIFHQDNFDKCMLLKDEALYCSFEYHLKPIYSDNNALWTNIQEISSNQFNYRHDILRHWICVPFTCPNATKTIENMDELKRDINNCYDHKMGYYKLKGIVENLSCTTNIPKYSVGWLDVFAATIFICYIVITILITLTEIAVKSWSPDKYEIYINTYRWKIISCFSLTKNWYRLTSISDTTEQNYLRPLFGIRSLNTFLVIFSHTCMAAVMLPVVNTKYTETMNLKFLNLFVSSGPLCVSTFFLISSIMLSFGIFTHFENKKLTPKTLITIFINRYIRLTPAMSVVILFNITWWRHLGDGPNWHIVIGTEYTRCRKNWWINLLYLNTILDPYNMCSPSFWYLAADTQYFVLLLVLLWYIKKNEKRIWYILGSCILLNIVGTFVNNYINDFEALNIPRPETVYNMKNIVGNPLWHGQFISTIGNSCGSIFGIGFGYLYYKTKNINVFNERKAMWKILFYILTYVPALSAVLVPSWFVLVAQYPHNAVVSSIIAAICRPIFISAIGFFIFGCIQGIAGPSDNVVRWTPIYILGRIAYGAYLVHCTLILSRAAISRSPTYANDALIAHSLFGDLAASYLLGFLLTLFVEMPISALQKLLVPTYSKEPVVDSKKDH